MNEAEVSQWFHKAAALGRIGDQEKLPKHGLQTHACQAILATTVACWILTDAMDNFGVYSPYPVPELTSEQAMRLAVEHHQAGHLQEAECIYRQVLARQPRHAEALGLLGAIAYQTGRNDIAVDLIQQAIALKPGLAEAHNNLGSALKDTGRLDEAIAAYRQAIALKSDFAEAHSNLGNALANAGRLDEAIVAYRQAITLKPDFAEAYGNLGIAMANAGLGDEAIAAYRQAIVLKPDLASAHINLGNALVNAGRLDEAIAACRQTIALKPDIAEAYFNLGNALANARLADQAIAAYRRAIALKPDLTMAHNNLGSVLKDAGRLDEAIAAYRQALTLNPDDSKAHSNLVYAIQFHPAYDAPTIAEEHRRWNQRHATPLQPYLQPHLNDPSPCRRLRVGYISPDFREHVVGRFLLPLLANHDKSQIHVFAYADVLEHDALTRTLGSHVDDWRSIVGLPDDKAAALIRQDGIDILVDLTMHMAHNRMLIFARKPAPVQVTYLAYCSTTGLDTIDYRLSDHYLDPPGANESVYSEKTLRLPETYWCYQPGRACPEVRQVPALTQGYITFGCLNNFCKVNEPTLATWARILLATPNSRLLLHAGEGAHRLVVQERLRREGIEPQRVRFSPSVPSPEYFSLYHNIDLALDPFPYGGGTTTCDSLYMGVPVVSLVGKTGVGRGGLSILSNLGLPELAVRSEDEYVHLATTLATDLTRLCDLRSTLRRRMEQSPLMDAQRFARGIEAAYRDMWRTWCGRNKPA